VSSVQSHRIVTKADWIEARRAFLVKEKELTRLRDRLAEERRALPWVKIEKPYIFDGPAGNVTLAELFDGRSQLLIKHFMMGPSAATQCVGCSFEVDHVEGILAHLNNHDVTFAVVARGTHRGNRGGAQAHGLEIPVGLLLSVGIQL
jgi:predicted dithiol-disulfide oxidoreductase (DUF899 family)